MRLRGQQEGYAMAALLVGLSIAAVMMSVAMPAWNQMARREREAELVFRGEQYARAIGLFQRKMGPGTLPPSIDLLVEQRFLRKKYKDPITNDDFAPILLSAATQQAPGTQAAQGAPARGGAPPLGQRGSVFGGGAPTTGAFGGITGVTSKSKEQSIRTYKGRNHYNEWQFVFTPPTPAAGSGAPGAPGAGGQRGRGQGPGNPQSPFPPTAPPGRGSPGGGRSQFPTGPQSPGPNNPAAPGRGPVFTPGPPPPGR